MIHRRLLHDDVKGVTEHLNETEDAFYHNGDLCLFPKRIGTGLVVAGTHYLLLDSPSKAAATWRPLHNQIWRAPVVGFSPLVASDPSTIKAWINSHNVSSLGSSELPINVELMSLYAAGNGNGLLRLAHSFAVGEDASLSNSVNVSLSALFKTITLTDAVEVSLTGNQLQSDLDMKIRGTEKLGYSSEWPARRRADDSTPAVDVVTLGPMQVKTFQISFTPNKEVL